jgi:hypothetical protein
LLTSSRALAMIGIGLLPLEPTFFNVGRVVRLPLPDLIGEVVEARRALPRLIELFERIRTRRSRHLWPRLRRWGRSA